MKNELGISDLDKLNLKKELIKKALQMQMMHADGHAKNFFYVVRKSKDGYVADVVGIDFDMGVRSMDEVRKLYKKTSKLKKLFQLQHSP